MNKMQVSQENAKKFIQQGRSVEVSYRRGSTLTFGERRENIERLSAAMQGGRGIGVAVKLSLGVSVVLTSKRTDVVAFADIWANAIEAHGDPYAATRRAIVRAAAAISEKM